MARPRKQIKRTERVTLRFTKTNMIVHRRNAERAGKPISVYLEELADGIEMKPRLTEAEVAALPHIIGVSNNLNQCVKVLHANGVAVNAVEQLFSMVNDLLYKLR